MYKYELTYSVDVGKAVPGVGDVFDRVNEHMANMGFREELKARAQIVCITIELPRPLPGKHEESIMKFEIEGVLRGKFPDLDVRCDSIRRKSCNSCSQPVSR